MRRYASKPWRFSRITNSLRTKGELTRQAHRLWRRWYGIEPTRFFCARYGTAAGATYCFYVELLPPPQPLRSSTVRPERDDGRAAASPVRSFLFYSKDLLDY